MFNHVEDGAAGTTYLEPQGFSDRNLGRQFSANDSGIVEFHGSRNSSRIGLSIPNDNYRSFDSDQENFPITPRGFYPGPQRMTGHAPVCTQFSFPMSAPTSNPMRDKLKAYEETSRNKDDLNVYTSIDDACLAFHRDPDSKAGDVCSYRPIGSRQVSVDSSGAKGKANIIYEPPRVEQSRTLEGVGGKGRPLSKRCCVGVLFNLIAVAAFVLAVVQFLPRNPSTEYEHLAAVYQSLKTENGELKRSLNDFENKMAEMLTTQLKQLNNSLDSVVASNDDDIITQLLSRLLSNDSDHQKKLVEYFEDKMDTLKAEFNSNVVSAEKEMSQLVSVHDKQLRMHLSGLVPINMSACQYDYRSLGISAQELEYSTEHFEFNNKFLLRVFCTTEGGTEAFLDYTVDSPNKYRCTCRGKRDEVRSRYCTIHYWTCPYI